MNARNQWLLDEVSQQDSVLEIGPGEAPVAPKREGWNTLVVDHLSRAGLLSKYGYSQDAEATFEDVDVVIADGATLLDSVPEERRGTFDAIIASHVFEHLPDPIRFLRTCDELLSETGTLRMAVPDKRLCFDYFRPLSSTGDLLSAYLKGDVVHSIKTTYDAVAYALTMQGSAAWGDPRYSHPGLAHDLGMAEACVDRAVATSTYWDFHAWVFTPSSFELLFMELNRLRLVTLQISAIQQEVGSEFLVKLRREAIPLADTEVQARRLALLEGMTLELAEQATAIRTARARVGKVASSQAA